MFNKSLLFKLDLELACDHVNEKFLDFSMLQMGFGLGVEGMEEVGQFLHLFSEILGLGEWKSVQLLW